METIKKQKAFTLAEVLITLAIIGVVAALTIPTLITNYKKNLYVTQLKKEYNAITNAFRTAMAKDGVTKLTDTSLWSKLPKNGLTKLTNIQNNPEIKEEFFKIFNVVEFPNAEYYTYKNLDGSSQREVIGYGKYNHPLCFADGACFISISLAPTSGISECGTGHKCSSLKEFQEYHNTPTKLWQYNGAITIDVNGPKGPNQTGRDTFSFAIGNDGNLYPSYGLDYAIMYGIPTYDYNSTVNDQTSPYYWRYSNGAECDVNNTYYGGCGCTARIMEEGWKMNY